MHLLQNLFQISVFLEQISLQKLVSLDTQSEVKTSTEKSILFIKLKLERGGLDILGHEKMRIIICVINYI